MTKLPESSAAAEPASARLTSEATASRVNVICRLLCEGAVERVVRLVHEPGRTLRQPPRSRKAGQLRPANGAKATWVASAPVAADDGLTP